MMRTKERKGESENAKFLRNEQKKPRYDEATSYV